MRAVYRRRLPRYAAVIGLVAAVGVLPGLSFADGDTSNDVSTVNAETIQTYLDADANINDSRIYEQLTLTGDGQVTVDNPVDSDGLRNLDGFGGLDAKDGNLQQQYDVNGVARSRTVSNFDSSKLPISVDVTYELDGKTVSADDLVGATGDVNVSYTVKNLTAKKMPLTYSDGNGGTKTEVSDVSIPLVGTVVFDLPELHQRAITGREHGWRRSRRYPDGVPADAVPPHRGEHRLLRVHRASDQRIGAAGLLHGCPGRPAQQPDVRHRGRQLPVGRCDR